MLDCFFGTSDATLLEQAIPIDLITPEMFKDWFSGKDEFTKSWVLTVGFSGQSGAICQIPDKSGKLAAIVVGISDKDNLWNCGSLPFNLPEGQYRLASSLSREIHNNGLLAWGLGSYCFSRYKLPKRKPAQLLFPSLAKTEKIEKNSSKGDTSLSEADEILQAIQSAYYVRDLVNTPADDMSPETLADLTSELGKEFSATVTIITGDELIQANYPGIYTVGKASAHAPRLIDLRWGNTHHPRVTLVGKGVCFDTGGLDLKPAPFMALMKKDMGGAAHVLALARLIMTAKLPIQLRVLIPAVENAVSGNAFYPGDVIKTRKGLTVEVGNTDAEGRVILADALYEASLENPELIIDIATLTGAAKAATGPDIPTLFCNRDDLTEELLASGKITQDPLWPLPLHKPYREYLKSAIADINNESAYPYAGAITAALFLEEFIGKQTPWVHLDLMAWNIYERPGRPLGGEAQGIRAIFNYLKKRFK